MFCSQDDVLTAGGECKAATLECELLDPVTLRAPCQFGLHHCAAMRPPLYRSIAWSAPTAMHGLSYALRRTVASQEFIR